MWEMRILFTLGTTQGAVRALRCSVVGLFGVRRCPYTDRPHNGDAYMCQKEGSEAGIITTRTRIKKSNRCSCLQRLKWIAMGSPVVLLSKC